MKTTIPIQKSKEDIRLYRTYAPYFGKALYKLFLFLKEGKIVSGVDLEKYFCASFPYWEDVQYPFAKEQNYLGEPFNHSICVSVNDKIGHGRPTTELFKTGDIISVDCGVSLPTERGRKLHYDSAFTVCFNSPQPDWIFEPYRALCKIVDEQSKSIHEIAKTISNTAKEENLQVVVSLTGHGIGYALHEAPYIRNAPGNYADTQLIEGLCFCIEPMYVLPIVGETLVPHFARTYVNSDGWSVITENGQPSSHFESMFCINNGNLVDLVGVTDWFR